MESSAFRIVESVGVGVVGDVVTMVGGEGDGGGRKLDVERDLARGKKCFKRALTEYRGERRAVDWRGEDSS